MLTEKPVLVTINERPQDLLRVAQNESSGTASDKARQKARDKSPRAHKASDGEKPASFDPPLPTRRKSTAPATSAPDEANTAQPASSHTIAPEVDQALGRLLLFYFKGNQPSNSGPKAIRTLLQSGHIAGAVFSSDNIASKAQLKEMMKFLWQGNASSRPIFATSELGGDTDPFPAIKDFEQWPSPHTIAAKGDAQYAYSTYQSMASNLSVLGFNLNFGPSLLSSSSPKTQPSSSFGTNALQAGVFAKTFVLGHREFKRHACADCR